MVVEKSSQFAFMWQPYAGLFYLHKPVDLIMLNTDEHVLTNPAVRMASQGASVDCSVSGCRTMKIPTQPSRSSMSAGGNCGSCRKKNERKEKEQKSDGAAEKPGAGRQLRK